MPVSCQNPLGLEGFAFVEFATPNAEVHTTAFERLGFVETHRHAWQDVSVFRQGQIYFVLNAEPAGHAARTAARHGPTVCGMGFRVSDAQRALRLAVQQGAKAADAHATPYGEDVPALQGVGGTLIYLIDDVAMRGHAPEGWRALHTPPVAQVNGAGLVCIDHINHALRKGQMQTWADFYVRVLGFESQRYFDLDTHATGMEAQALVCPQGQIRIPLSESRSAYSATEAFLEAHGGEGVQHIALETFDIHATVEALKARGVRFQPVPAPYYDGIDARVPHHDEDIERLRRNGILIDGNLRREGILLQAFTDTDFGPVFFEIVQRKGNAGFGGGNIQALMEAAGLEQMRKGLLRV